MRVSRRFLNPFANDPMTRLRNLTRTDCDTNFGTKFGEQNVSVHQIRPTQRTSTTSTTFPMPVKQLPTSAVGFGWRGLFDFLINAKTTLDSQSFDSVVIKERRIENPRVQRNRLRARNTVPIGLDILQ